MTDKNLLLVNKNDEVLGFKDKESVHKEGLLHRAFSVYIFNNKGQLLIQQRSKLKPLWPLYWANSCCSHPREGEDYERAGERRMKEELGFEVPLRQVDKFVYKRKYKNAGFENEVCAVLVGQYDGKPNPDSKEVAGYKWIDEDKLLSEFKIHPKEYTPWLKIGFKRYIKIKKREAQEKQKINIFLESLAKKVEPAVNKLLTDNTDKKFHKIIKYQVATGGKKLRPALAIISCRLLGGKIEDAIYPAAGIEILHNYTLIIDDIIDHGILRRGKPTVWKKFGVSVAECAGADYTATAFSAANFSKYPVAISQIFSETLKTIFDGELYDVLFEQGGREDEPYVIENRYLKVGKENYYKMIEKKTAFLFGMCCKIGGICADGKDNHLEALRKYGFNLGMAFQIQDDLLDIFGDESKFKKEIGKDVKERKLGNIVICIAFESFSESQRKDFLKIIQKKIINEKDVKKAIEIIKKTDAEVKAKHLAEVFFRKAKDSLKDLPENKWNLMLNNLVDIVNQREK